MLSLLSLPGDPPLHEMTGGGVVAQARRAGGGELDLVGFDSAAPKSEQLVGLTTKLATTAGSVNSVGPSKTSNFSGTVRPAVTVLTVSGMSTGAKNPDRV
jgi:hypothetical protein